MKLTFASGNKNKFLEIEKIIPNKFQLGNLSDLNFFDEIPENEDSIERNAAYKAKFIHSKFNHCNYYYSKFYYSKFYYSNFYYLNFLIGLNQWLQQH